MILVGCLEEVLLLELEEGSEGGVAKLTIPPGDRRVNSTNWELVKCIQVFIKCIFETI